MASSFQEEPGWKEPPDGETARNTGKAVAPFLTKASTPGPRALQASLIPYPEHFWFLSPLSPSGASVPPERSLGAPQDTRSESIRQASPAPSRGQLLGAAIFLQARTPLMAPGAFTTFGKSPVFLFALEMGAHSHSRCRVHRRDPSHVQNLLKIPLRQRRVPVYPFPEPPKYNPAKKKRKY